MKFKFQIHLASSRQPSSTRTPRTPLPRAARSLTKTSKKSCFSDNERKENLLSSLYQLDARTSQSKISSNSRSNANLKLLGVKSRSEQSLAAKSQRNLSLIKKPSLNKQNFKQTLRKSSPSSRARIVQKLKLSEGSEVNKNLNSNLTESFKGASKSNSAKPKQSKLENLANELITNKSSSIPISSTVQKKLKLKIRDGLFQKQSHQYPNKSVPKRLKISQFIKYTDRSSKEKFNIRRNPSKEKVEVESISSSNSSAEDATLSWDTVYALSVAGSSSCASDAGPSTKRLSRSLRRPPLRNHQI